MSTIVPPTQADAIVATHKRWALDHLAHAVREHQRSEFALQHLVDKARQYGCSAAEIDALLRPAGGC